MSDPVEKYEEILDLLSRPIAFHRAFVKIGGGVTAGVMLSQAFYWSRNKRARERGGWFYKSHTTWEEETGLTRREQQTARKHLREAGLLEEKEGPLPSRGGGRVVWYRVNLGVLFEKLSGLPRAATPPPGGGHSADTSEAGAADGCDAAAGSCAAQPLHGGAQSVAPELSPAGEIAQAVAPQRPTSLITSETTSQSTAEKTTENTHTRAARAPSPPRTPGDGDGVRVVLSFEDYRDFARSKPTFRNPDAWAMKHFAMRDADVLVSEFLGKRGLIRAGKSEAGPAPVLFHNAAQYVYSYSLRPGVGPAEVAAYIDGFENVTDETRAQLREKFLAAPAREQDGRRLSLNERNEAALEELFGGRAVRRAEAGGVCMG